MCTTIVPLKKTDDKSYEPPTAAERQARIEALHHMTASELAHCRRIVYKRVPASFGDAEECLSDGLEVALKKYAGLSNLATFVAKCAHTSALNYYTRRAKRQLSLDRMLEDHRGKGDEDDRALADLLGQLDPELVEEVDPYLIERMRRALNEMVNYKVWHRRPSVIAAAHKMLSELCESANTDKGIGVTEYDDAPLKTQDARTRSHRDRNSKIARREMYHHLAERYDTDDYTVKYVFTALRKSAEVALRERQLAE